MAWIVMERNYEYNDEIFCGPDDDEVGIPRRSFPDRKGAQDACLELNINWIKNIEPNCYYYSERDFFCDPELAAQLLEVKDLSDSITVPTSLEKSEYEKLIDCIYPDKLGFFVMEILD